MQVTPLLAMENVPRAEVMLGSPETRWRWRYCASSAYRCPLRRRDPNTAEVLADGAELIKVAVDGTRQQLVALLAELRSYDLPFEFATP